MFFDVVLKDDVPFDDKIFAGHFVQSIKIKQSDELSYKARFVVHGHEEIEKHMHLHSSRISKRLFVQILNSVTASFKFLICSHDVYQTYLQAAEKLMYDIFIRPIEEFWLLKKSFLRLL